MWLSFSNRGIGSASLARGKETPDQPDPKTKTITFTSTATITIIIIILLSASHSDPPTKMPHWRNFSTFLEETTPPLAGCRWKSSFTIALCSPTPIQLAAARTHTARQDGCPRTEILWTGNQGNDKMAWQTIAR